LSYNASVVKIYRVTNSMAFFIIKFFSLLKAGVVCSCKFKSRRIGSCRESNLGPFALEAAAMAFILEQECKQLGTKLQIRHNYTYQHRHDSLIAYIGSIIILGDVPLHRYNSEQSIFIVS
jgi:non-ribosomal peptide synthetase component E (peptide arylation enzyme)